MFSRRTLLSKSSGQKVMEYEVPANENASRYEAVEEKFVELDLATYRPSKDTFEDEFSFEDFIKSYSTIGLKVRAYIIIEIIRTVEQRKYLFSWG